MSAPGRARVGDEARLVTSTIDTTNLARMLGTYLSHYKPDLIRFIVTRSVPNIFLRYLFLRLFLRYLSLSFEIPTTPIFEIKTP